LSATMLTKYCSVIITTTHTTRCTNCTNCITNYTGLMTEHRHGPPLMATLLWVSTNIFYTRIYEDAWNKELFWYSSGNMSPLSLFNKFLGVHRPLFTSHIELGFIMQLMLLLHLILCPVLKRLTTQTSNTRHNHHIQDSCPKYKEHKEKLQSRTYNPTKHILHRNKHTMNQKTNTSIERTYLYTSATHTQNTRKHFIYLSF
jgi:hypothetical protein